MDSAYNKIENAKKHLLFLREFIELFFKSNPYIIKSKIESKTNRRIYFLEDVKEIPIEISLISGDILQNLRSALDHLAFSLLKENKNKLGKFIYFPIFDNKKEYDNGKKNKTNGIPENKIKLIDECKPYKDGNIHLWQLHKLNIIDKHRLLVTVGSSYGGFDVGAHLYKTMMDNFPKDLKLPKFELFLNPADNLFPLKKGVELFIDGSNAEEIPDMKFNFKILINEIGIVEGEPLLEFMNKKIEETENILVKFK